MRNLKKILAMVLALVMSLSLMAAASAANFTDASEINEKYQTAVDVLEGLGVFKGYDENGSYSFKPTGEITRAETAAIIYRIVTGDVKDEQVGIYADYNIFTDVPKTAWYAGYVNFCANAEYIKGYPDKTFKPSDKVEGYAALAMILRAIGYTANGGFTGNDWRVQTARVGEARQVTKNITEGTLRANADRQTVAEILYQAIMVDMVDHDVLHTLNGEQGYTTIPQTLGQKTFGLEQVSGVILANEWANLVGTKVLDADTTLMEVNTTYATQSRIKTGDDPIRLTLNDKTETEMQAALDGVGMTYDAHLANPNLTKGTADVLTLDVSPINNVSYNEGKGVYASTTANGYLNNGSWADVADLADDKGIKLVNDTEYYINYANEWLKDVTSDMRIAYAVAKTENGKTEVANATWQAYFEYLAANYTAPTYAPAKATYEGYSITGHSIEERTLKIDIDNDGNIDPTEEFPCYVVAIRPECIINELDTAIMQELFYSADRLGAGNTTADQLHYYLVGEVYAGTTSTYDYSDEMSWLAFQEKFFIEDVNSKKFDTCAIGNSLRVIDNDDDGNADYVLRIDYTQDKVIGTYKNQPAGYNKAIGSYEGNLLYNPQADEIVQGTVFNYTVIDEKLYVWPAPVVTGIAATKDFNKITITVDGEVYNQSGIKNDTRLDENIMFMDQNTTYNMYMDVYGNNIRSYELAQGSKWALLTEMYPTSDRNSNYVQNWGAIAEVKIQDADVTEYPVTVGTDNSGPNLFFNPTIWTWGTRNYLGVNAGTSSVIPNAGLYNANYLQPAVAHLGIGNLTTTNNVTVASAAWRGATTNVQATDAAATNLQFWVADWYRYVAQAVKYPAAHNGDPVPHGAGSTYGVFDYGTTTYDPNNTPLNPNDDIENPTFSFTNVAAYVDNDGTLALSSASKLSTDRSSGARLYRVGTAAATGEKSNVITGGYLWQIGTEDALVKAYDAYILAGGTPVTQKDGTTALATGQAWFDYCADIANYGNGDGIYPVYESDYVQLDLTQGDMGQALTNDIAVKAGTRHYHIADGDNNTTNYKVDYNTNSNSYVDATVNTEFYIVMPGSADIIQYHLGYADLPTILSKNIRAAYAVAHNTSAQNDNQDYWVADVIVIELDELSYDYDSISLVYNNPYVQNSYVRYADSLNNDWRTLQPDYDGLAKMGLTPKSGFTNNGWGSWSWSNTSTGVNAVNYGFWKLYQTELTAPGQLNVGDVEQIDDHFNANGIYAGTITRVEELAESGYLDVSVQNTGFSDTHLIDVNYGTANEVPFYRITKTNAAYGAIYSAELMNPNQSLRWSDIQNGDEIIWVYDQTNPKQLAFVVDLGSRAKADGDSLDYTAPVWLFTLYSTIWEEENPDPAANWTVDVTSVVLPNGTEITTDIGDYVTVTNPATGVPVENVKTRLTVTPVDGALYMIDKIEVTSPVSAADPTLNATAAQEADGSWYLFNVKGNVTLKVTLKSATYEVTLTGTDLGGSAAVAMEDTNTNDPIASGTEVAGGTEITVTLTSPTANTKYTVVKTVGSVAGDPEDLEGPGYTYTFTVTGTTSVEVKGVAASNDGALTGLTATGGTDPATDDLDNGDAPSITDFDFGTTTTDVTFTVSPKATVKVWKGAEALNMPVTVTAGAADDTYTCTLDVGENGAGKAYVVQVFSEAGNKITEVTLTLAAAGASSNIDLQASTAGTGKVNVTATAGTPGTYTITILAAGEGYVTGADLLSYIEAKTGETVKDIQLLVSTGGAEITGDALNDPVVNTNVVKVTAENDSTQEYTISFGTI